MTKLTCAQYVDEVTDLLYIGDGEERFVNQSSIVEAELLIE